MYELINREWQGSQLKLTIYAGGEINKEYLIHCSTDANGNHYFQTFVNGHLKELNLDSPLRAVASRYFQSDN